jgi:hypothetical protein
MKRFSLRLLGLCTLLIAMMTISLNAQSESEAIIIQKITHEDGSVTTVKKRVPKGADVKTLAEEFDTEQGEVEIHILSESDDMDIESEGETIFMYRQARAELKEAQQALQEAQKELESLRIIVHEREEGQEQDFDFDFNFNFDDQDWSWKGNGESQGNGVPRTRTERATKAFLGIYPKSTNDGVGVAVDGIVRDAGAQQAGIKSGDVIKSLDGLPTNGTYGLTGVLKKIAPGSTVTAEVVRDGQVLQIPVTLGQKEYNRKVWNEERDPCEVFIGVYVGGRSNRGQGVQVTGIIGNTPASTYGVESGDVILAMDGIAVNDNDELLVERDKHDAGDPFVLTVIRGESQMDINACFKSCEEIEEDGAIEEEPIEIPEINQPEPEEPAVIPGGGGFQVNGYQAFPNPTFGRVRVRFGAEAIPTTVQVSDATGRIIYQNQINNFNGNFDEEIDLKEAVPGTLTLTIRQGNDIMSKQLVLLNRA